MRGLSKDLRRRSRMGPKIEKKPDGFFSILGDLDLRSQVKRLKDIARGERVPDKLSEIKDNSEFSLAACSETTAKLYLERRLKDIARGERVPDKLSEIKDNSEFSLAACSETTAKLYLERMFPVPPPGTEFNDFIEFIDLQDFRSDWYVLWFELKPLDFNDFVCFQSGEAVPHPAPPCSSASGRKASESNRRVSFFTCAGDSKLKAEADPSVDGEDVKQLRDVAAKNCVGHGGAREISDSRAWRLRREDEISQLHPELKAEADLSVDGEDVKQLRDVAAKNCVGHGGAREISDSRAWRLSRDEISQLHLELKAEADLSVDGEDVKQLRDVAAKNCVGHGGAREISDSRAWRLRREDEISQLHPELKAEADLSVDGEDVKQLRDVAAKNCVGHGGAREISDSRAWRLRREDEISQLHPELNAEADLSVDGEDVKQLRDVAAKNCVGHGGAREISDSRAWRLRREDEISQLHPELKAEADLSVDGEDVKQLRDVAAKNCVGHGGAREISDSRAWRLRREDEISQLHPELKAEADPSVDGSIDKATYADRNCCERPGKGRNSEQNIFSRFVTQWKRFRSSAGCGSCSEAGFSEVFSSAGPLGAHVHVDSDMRDAQAG
ncbi:hypothetical protein MPTK1_2g23310 [Marchantia polymorpha subsp. ruderalis]|nr:hypothetical protein Mp_2g23310 [Marchantia polymorpha subsp. ruderalis]